MCGAVLACSLARHDGRRGGTLQASLGSVHVGQVGGEQRLLRQRADALQPLNVLVELDLAVAIRVQVLETCLLVLGRELLLDEVLVKPSKLLAVDGAALVLVKLLKDLGGTRAQLQRLLRQMQRLEAVALGPPRNKLVVLDLPVG